MSDVLVFPDTRGALYELINSTDHATHIKDGEPATEPVRAAYHVIADDHGTPITDTGPLVVIISDPGTQGWVDRVDRISLDCYAPGEHAMNVLNSILGMIVDYGIETPSGAYLDAIEVDQTPHELPYPSDTLNHAMCRLLVTVRPV